MRATEAYAKLLALSTPVVTTREASALFRTGRVATVNLLNRLAADGLLVRVKRGLWAIADRITAFSLAKFLTAPLPAYISLWTALYHHGMIAQVPRIIHVVSLARPRRVRTALGTYQIHWIRPELFGGFQVTNGTAIAGPEKALFDTIYILGIWRKRSVRLPEVELPRNFALEEIERWVNEISVDRLRTVTRSQLDRVLSLASQRNVENARRNGPQHSMAQGARRGSPPTKS